MDTERPSLGFEQVLGILRRRAPWILLCFVLVAAAAYGFSKHQTKKYTATASLVFNNNQLGQQVAGLPVASSNNQQAQQNTNLKLVQPRNGNVQIAQAAAVCVDRHGVVVRGSQGPLHGNLQ